MKHSFLLSIPIFTLITGLLVLSCSDPHHSEPNTNKDSQHTQKITLSIDRSVTYQTIQGFGGFGAEKVWWASPPFYSDEYVDLLMHDLGVTILRDNLPIGFEPENDNADPAVLDLSKFNLNLDTPGADSHLSQHFEYLTAMHRAGLDKLIVSVWSPPIWMKHNNHRGNGSDLVERRTSAPPYTKQPNSHTNQLRVDLYEEFAEYCVAYIRVLKQHTGIDLYAISLQNEPRFSQFYASAVYSPEALRDLITVVGKRFAAENISTKIFMPEDVQNIDTVVTYINAVLNDPEAEQYTDILATHNYRGDGVLPAEEVPSHWRRTADLANTKGKEVWMTETSGFDTESFEGAMALALSMYNALHYGDISAWVYWQMSEGFFTDGDLHQPNELYFVSKHFYRHIRPGALRTKIVSNDDRLLALYFQQKTEDSDVVILVNNSHQPFEITFALDSHINVRDMIITQPTSMYQRVTNIDPTRKIPIIPPRSIVTLTTTMSFDPYPAREFNP